MDNQSLSHSRYNCTYHIVFIPKYWRKVMFGDLRREVAKPSVKYARWKESGSCAYVCVDSPKGKCGESSRPNKGEKCLDAFRQASGV